MWHIYPKSNHATKSLDNCSLQTMPGIRETTHREIESLKQNVSVSANDFLSAVGAAATVAEDKFGDRYYHRESILLRAKYKEDVENLKLENENLVRQLEEKDGIIKEIINQKDGIIKEKDLKISNLETQMYEKAVSGA